MVEKAKKVQKKPLVKEKKENERNSMIILEKPNPGYIKKSTIIKGVSALKKLIKKSPALNRKTKRTNKPKNLLETEDSAEYSKVYVDVVFKNIPSNAKTYIHNIVLPHHWRIQLEPEDCDIAIFVPHRKPDNEAQKIQFSKDRDLDIENTHSYYQNLFLDKLKESTRARISRLITSKELATEFNTFQKIDRLSKTYDLFLSDKKLMSNKFNALPRRLGRRFWVREKKVPLIIKLEAEDLEKRFNKVLSTEPFYVIGRSSTERIQLGLISQKTSEIVDNIVVFLNRLYELYGNHVRFLKLRSNSGLAIPIFADLSPECSKEVRMNKKRIQPKPVVGEFDLLPGSAQVSVHASGTVRVVRPSVKVKRKLLDDESPGKAAPKKKVKI